jgi:hypothetical protein
MRFNQGGETWIMRNCYRRNKFPLREAFEQAIPFERQPGFDCFMGSDVPGVNADQLAYFAESLFWRASCHEWRYESRTALGARSIEC